ncbi:MAG: hypothetical protein AAFQ85_12405, partial [Pseudomonadota bacterium]
MIEATRLGFEPLIPYPYLLGLCALAALAWLAYAILRGRAWLTRGLALTVLAGALSNPAIIEEERDPLPSVAAIVLDGSESMAFGDREDAARAVYDAYVSTLTSDDSIELRVVESPSNVDGTNLVAALEGLMADVPRDQIAGTIFITDGQVHDVPQRLRGLQDLGPVHSIIVGDPGRGDRRVEIVDGPDFGIVGETADYIVRVEDPVAAEVTLDVSLNGGEPRRMTFPTGVDTPLPIEIERRGDNVLVLEAPAGAQELTLANNRTAANLSGVRDRLRVLLITGRPNAAGRVWRDLLKSDPSVDLVHFTILRPPFKQDITPIEELALIAFPTDELFQDKLTDFDLIIFDQYERRGV